MAHSSCMSFSTSSSHTKAVTVLSHGHHACTKLVLLKCRYHCWCTWILWLSSSLSKLQLKFHLPDAFTIIVCTNLGLCKCRCYCCREPCTLSRTVQLQVLLLLDVDFMVSSSLNELQHSAWLQNSVSQGMLVVLPALEPIKSDAAAQQSVLKTCQGEQILL